MIGFAQLYLPSGECGMAMFKTSSIVEQRYQLHHHDRWCRHLLFDLQRPDGKPAKTAEFIFSAGPMINFAIPQTTLKLIQRLVWTPFCTGCWHWHCCYCSRGDLEDGNWNSGSNSSSNNNNNNRLLVKNSASPFYYLIAVLLDGSALTSETRLALTP